ncbi:hypothetical protein BBB39_15700 [Bordetella trematum]|uniref:Uncharacterized protein n=1 Tax=Bordetella trematum TaxID=123899 RepID=A0A157S7G4_9BORD|nr:hypothetical protein BBB39_15700 [Bordetella trematum]SAI37500.1 Uncharacterised protein [Bordetella trematum]SAI66357.1 Uncharacterised protein [Bordetella trematum]SUV96644.1 Uncharacterised protein [Bordetella trematum]
MAAVHSFLRRDTVATSTNSSRRPWYVTLLALLFLGINGGLLIDRGLPTLWLALTREGTVYMVLLVVMLNAVWLANAVASVGLLRRAAWARTLLVAGMFALWLVTSADMPDPSVGKIALRGFIYALVLVPLFTARANAYLRGQKPAAAA